MFWGAIDCGILMIIYISLTTLKNPTTATNWASMVTIILYNVVFAFGWLGTCWVYGPEISLLKYRDIAGSLGAAGERFSTFIIVFGGGTGLTSVGPKIFAWPLVCCFIAAAYVWFQCPETTGLTLEEIDVLFARGETKARLEAENAERRASLTGDAKAGVIYSEKGHVSSA
ncbi:unnamed protein product [Zymoseptoria tritici ST99CH_3D1]|nr:unnamed protein product [Zymoseptoria tritici ST99CH_1E4]SMR54854.1 unnamed protein product [Zymoseptoria tritici ST99CH_3D1]